MKHVKTFESVNEAAFKGQDAYEDAYEWIKYSLNIPHAKEIIGKLKRRFKSKPFSEDDVRQIMSESLNEAAADITSDQLDKFLKSKFKNKGDKETYDIVVTSQDSRNDDDEEDDYVTDVAIGYDVHTKAGHVRAEDDVFFDLDQQKWFDNWLNGGDMKSLPNVEKIIKNHIKKAKKGITG